MFVADDKDHVTSPLPDQAERDRDIVRQRKRETDSAARLQDKLRQATDREAQLQRQLSKLQAQLKQEVHQRIVLNREFKYYRQHSRWLSEEDTTKQRDSRHSCLRLFSALLNDNADIA